MTSALPAFTLFAVAIVVLIGLAIWSATSRAAVAERKRAEEESRQRAARAVRRDWRYDPTPQGDIRYRLHGTTPGGCDWSLEYDSDHSSSSSSPRLVFRAPRAGNGERAWAISDRGAHDMVRQGIGKVVIGGLAKLISLASNDMRDKRDFFFAAAEVETGIAEWQQRYVLIAQPGRFKRLVDRALARRILQWPAFKPTMSKKDNCFGAEAGPRGVQAHLYADGPSFEVIEHLVRIGEALADGTQRELHPDAPTDDTSAVPPDSGRAA